MIFDYRNKPICCSQSQCDAETFPVFTFQATVHKPTNAFNIFRIQVVGMAPNILASESLPGLVLVGLLPMILTTLLDFDTSFH